MAGPPVVNTPPKGWFGLAGEALKRPAAWLLIPGVAFIALAVTTSLYTFTAYSELWRAVSAAAGFLLTMAGIAMLWREERPGPLAAAAKRPGPYTAGTYPIRIDGLAVADREIKAQDIGAAANRIVVRHDDQMVIVKASGRDLGKDYDYKLMLGHYYDDQKRISPRFAAIDRTGQRGGQTLWQTRVRLPDAASVTKQDEWRLAFYYVGPNSRRLAEHHAQVCEYFAPYGKPKRWPPIELDKKLDEFVQCSEVLILPFGPGNQQDNRQDNQQVSLSAAPVAAAAMDIASTAGSSRPGSAAR